jgi:hypothetical protein
LIHQLLEQLDEGGQQRCNVIHAVLTDTTAGGTNRRSSPATCADTTQFAEH